MSISILGAGFGRTGTLSLKTALEILGFGPCYHMESAFSRPFHARRWRRACVRPPQGSDGRTSDWKSNLRGFRSAVDWPACTFYRELMQIYPQAKLILTVRDPDRWYDSAAFTIYPVMGRFPLNRWGRLLPHAGDVGRMLDCLIWQGTFHGRFAERDYAIQVFNRHNQEVIDRVPPERLLVFDVRQGWEPLCRFLEVPVPEGVPFPHANERGEYWRRVRLLTGLTIAGLGGGVLLAAWSLWKMTAVHGPLTAHP